MNEQTHPTDLLGLLQGEFSNAEVARTAAHLDDCADCRDELAQLVVGHAMLTGATRTLAGRRRETPVLLPELTAPAPKPQTRARWLRPVGLIAAAAVLVAGTAGVTRSLVTDAAPPRPPVAVETPQVAADLAAVEGSGAGEVTMASHDNIVVMTFAAHDLPRLKRGQFYYGWLLDPETNKMLPLGQIGPDGKASFEVSTTLLTKYGAIDVSIEDDDGDPGHSVTSVLRGAYDPGTVES